MPSNRLSLFALALVVLVGTFLLLALGRTVPDLVATLDTILVSAAAGAALPGRTGVGV